MLHLNQQITRIAILGTGHVGATCAYALQLRGLASEIVLINNHRERAEGEAMDLNHGSLFGRPARIWAGDYSDCKDADIVVLAAGAAQQPGETRLSLLQRNATIIQHSVLKVVQQTRDAILILVSNPVDVLTYLALKASGLPSQKVVGSGTILDTARFRYLLGLHFNIEPRSIHAYVIGEHGDSQVPVWSLANIAGIRLDDYSRLNSVALDNNQREKIAKKTRTAAYEIITRKGATYYAIAAGVVRIIEAIVRDENSVLTVSGLANNKHGLNDVTLSLPSVINRKGIACSLELSLSRQEEVALMNSAQVIQNAIRSLELEPMIKPSIVPQEYHSNEYKEVIR